MLRPIRLAMWVLLVAHEAHAAEPQRVAVRVADPTSRALMQRVRGQTSDLGVELVEVDEPPLEARVSDEVATARVLASRLGARVVVWFEEGPGVLTLFFTLPDEGRTLVRSMPAEISARGTPSSATFEASALVVRSVLRAIESGATIGLTLAAPLDLPSPTPPIATPHLTAPVAPPPEPPATPSAGRPWGFRAAVGWHATFADARTFLQGGETRATLSRGGFAGGVQLAVDAPAESSGPDASVRLLRLAGGAFVAYRVPLGERWRFALGVAGGAVGFHRETASVGTGVTRAPDAWLGSALVAPEAGISFRSGGSGPSWGIGLRVGADVVVTPPIIGDEIAGAFVAEHVLSTVEPKLVLEVELGSP